MAKQRGAKPRVPAKVVRTSSAAAPHPLPSRPVSRPVPPAPPTPEKPPARASYVEAVALYEQGVAALQEHDYPRASSILRSVLSRYPGEKDLHERVRLYVNVCERHMAPRGMSPSTPEERVFAATLAFNAGNYDEALEHLRTASRESPDHDHVLYMLATVLALRDEYDEAVPHLLRAIDLNPENRSLARHDPDLEPLRQYDSVRAALESTTQAKAERHKVSRRSSR
jgi:tetratricopeptide (TPR) repeat protein